jgi:hypothetical protein
MHIYQSSNKPILFYQKKKKYTHIILEFILLIFHCNPICIIISLISYLFLYILLYFTVFFLFIFFPYIRKNRRHLCKLMKYTATTQISIYLSILELFTILLKINVCSSNIYTYYMYY